MTSMYGAANYRIANLFIQSSGGYIGQYRRSYETSLTPGLLNTLTTAALERTKLAPVNTFNKEDQLVRFSTAPEASVDIVNGWNTPRLRFLMIVHVKNHVGSVKVTRIQGYTDHADTSFSGHVDPNTKFYINQITEQMLSPGDVGFGQGERVQTISSNQYLHDTTFSNRGGVMATLKNFNMAPQHVFENMGNVEFTKNNAWDDEMMIDTRLHLNSMGTMASRAYELPGEYASTILNTYLGCKASDPNDAHTTKPDDFYSTCQTELVNDVAKKDHFCSWLEARKEENYRMVSDPNNVFTMSDLRAYDPNVKPEMIQADGNQFDAETMGNTTSETLFATQIVNGLVGLMSIYGIARVRFKCSNLESAVRKPVILPQYVNHSFPNIDCKNEVAGLFHRFENEVLRSASFCGEMGYTFDVACDLCSDSAIVLNLDGRGEYRYVIPTFCDSLMSPIITSNKAAFDNLTAEFDQIGELLYDSRRYSDVGAMEETGSKSSIFTDFNKPQHAAPVQNTGWSTNNDPFKSAFI